MFRKSIIVLFLFLLGIGSSYAQPWMNKTKKYRGKQNFYSIQRDFKRYWKNRKKEKGKGRKPFKRWEYYMEQRTFPTGDIAQYNRAFRNFRTYQRQFRNAQKNSTPAWKSFGPMNWINGDSGYNPGVGRINAVTVDPKNPQIIYAASAAGGLWKSIDGGINWKTSTDNLALLGTSDIAIDPKNSNILYLASGDRDGFNTYGIGVLKSLDAGKTWRNTGLNFSVMDKIIVNCIIVDPSNSKTLIASTTGGIYKSNDSGDNWKKISSFPAKKLVYKPYNNKVVYATGNSFYKSTNGGDSFYPISKGLPSNSGRIEIAITPKKPEYVYLIIANSSSQFDGVFRSSNSGESFSLRSSSPNLLGYSVDGSDHNGQAWYDLAIAVSPTNPEEVYTGAVNIWKSIDGGKSWKINTFWAYKSGYPYSHADIHSLNFYENVLYAGTDGGIFKTQDQGNSWEDLSRGLENSQFYRLGGTPLDPYLIVAGSQDNGSNLYKHGKWFHVLGGDGMEAAIDPKNINVIYVCIQNGDLRRSTNGGRQFQSISPPESGAWVTPYVLEQNNPNTLYIGCESVWKSKDRGDNWSAISPKFLPGKKIASLGVSISNSKYIYASIEDMLYSTTNGGVSWNKAKLEGYITYVFVHPENPSYLWITLSGYNAGKKVYESKDAGRSFHNISDNLPNLPANCITYQKGDRPVLYIGMDVGVYYRTLEMKKWKPYMNKLPHVIVKELEIHNGIGKLRAATLGRGLWEVDLFSR